jgi:probable HAF family extracellular repeat protein
MLRLGQLYRYAPVCAALAACGGQIGEQPGHPAGASAKVLAGVTTGSSSPGSVTTSWVGCAREGQTCEYAGPREVRYGANGTYVYKTFTGPVQCTNAAFGDPLPGVDKFCSYANDSLLAADWTSCAVQDGTCSVTDTRIVRYGASGGTGPYNYRIVTGSVQCSNAVFDDPAPNSKNICEVSLTLANLPPSRWTDCAQEDQQCSFSGRREVRYGADGTFTYKTLTGPVQCSNAVFGDPLPGVDKACSYSPIVTPPSARYWTFADLGSLGGDEVTVADINESGTVVGASRLADGSQHAYIYRRGRMSDLGVLHGDTHSVASGINNADIVVGTSSNASSSRPFVYKGGQLVQVSIPYSSSMIVARDNNDAEDILINHGPPCGEPCNYVVRKDGNDLDLDYRFSAGQRINNRGTILAYSGRSLEYAHLYNINDGSFRYVGPMANAPYLNFNLRSYDLNEKDEVVGTNAFGQPFLYQGNGSVHINTVVDGNITAVTALNDNTDLAGTLGAGGSKTAFFYEYGTGNLIDLSALPAVRQAQWRLDDVRAINNRGQIAGLGTNRDGQRRAFLLTPHR